MVEFRIDIFVSKTLYRLIELLVSLAKGQRGASDLSRERTGVSRISSLSSFILLRLKTCFRLVRACVFVIMLLKDVFLSSFDSLWTSKL